MLTEKRSTLWFFYYDDFVVTVSECYDYAAPKINKHHAKISFPASFHLSTHLNYSSQILKEKNEFHLLHLFGSTMSNYFI